MKHFSGGFQVEKLSVFGDMSGVWRFVSNLFVAIYTERLNFLPLIKLPTTNLTSARIHWQKPGTILARKTTMTPMSHQKPSVISTLAQTRKNRDIPVIPRNPTILHT